MAYQARQRDPLFDSDTQAIIERRGKELLGLALIVASGLLAALLYSYSPDDPSWLSVTDAPASNWLGRFGASLASPLNVIAGQGSWAIIAVLAVWGLRLMSHWGAERAIPRLIFAPIGVALVSVYASTHVPGADWSHSFGLGGLFGDTVLGAILSVLPMSPGTGLKTLSVLLFAGSFAMGAFVLGTTWDELARMRRIMMGGVILLYATMITLLGRGAVGALRVAADAKVRRDERRAADADFVEDDDDVAAFEEKSSFLSRLPGLRRTETPDLDAPKMSEDADAVKARIVAAVRSRVDRPEGSERLEPPVSLGAPQISMLNDDGEVVGFDSDMPEPELVEAPIDADEAARFQSRRISVPDPKAVVQHKTKKTAPSRRAKAEAQPGLFDASAGAFDIPPLGLLADPGVVQRHHLSDEALEQNARMLENVLDDYGVKGEIVSVRPGPVVTMYELEPAPGLKASRVIGLSDDIARSMSALSARVSTVPGRSVIGIELPNENREKVVLREILSARDFGDGNQRLPLALGKDIGGDPIVANLAKMPHLLIAGTTGSGKSVAINTMILSLLYKLTPEECRLIMIDPKMLELSVYDGIPHLLSPVVTDPKKAVVALKWTVGEMEERYRKMSKMGVRNIEGYNGRVRDALAKGEMFSRTVQTGFDEGTGEPIFETEEFAPELLPYIVVIVDEMADLMMVAGKEIEACIQRLAQMARASGIHLIMATQRPSVDVITGTIKANFPTRISFQVTSKVDSRTILGEMGAEQLLGMGDMLYMAGGGKITRVHGPFVSDEEVEEIVNHLKNQGAPEYFSGIVDGPSDDKSNDIDAVLGLTGGNTDGEDALYDQAVGIVIKDRKCSTSYIQRKLAIGYNKAARLVEQMEDQGIVSSANHVGKREILIPEQA